MKATIHPTYYDDAEVVCVGGNRFTIGATQKTIHVELCSNCHPFYTGEQRFVDTASRIQKFQTRQSKASDFQAKKKKKLEDMKKKASQSSLSLREMLMGLK